MHCRFLTIVHHSHFRYDPFSGWEPQIGLDCTREDNYGLRYLRMLVACVKSVFRLHDQKVLPLLAATDVTIVSLTAPLHDADSEWRSGLTLPIQSEDLKVSFISGRDVIPTFCIHQVEMHNTSWPNCCGAYAFGRSDHTSLM